MKEKRTSTDWEQLITSCQFDFIGTDPYYHLFNIEREPFSSILIKELLELAHKHNLEHQLWVQNFNLKKGDEDGIDKLMDTMYQMGVRNIAAWSYRGTEAMSKLATHDPEYTWERLCNKINELRSYEK